MNMEHVQACRACQDRFGSPGGDSRSSSSAVGRLLVPGRGPSAPCWGLLTCCGGAGSVLSRWRPAGYCERPWVVRPADRLLQLPAPRILFTQVRCCIMVTSHWSDRDRTMNPWSGFPPFWERGGGWSPGFLDFKRKMSDMTDCRETGLTGLSTEAQMSSAYLYHVHWNCVH